MGGDAGQGKIFKMTGLGQADCTMGRLEFCICVGTEGEMTEAGTRERLQEMLRKVMPLDPSIAVKSKEKEKEVGSREQLAVLSVCHHVVTHQEPCGNGVCFGREQSEGT